MFLVFVDFRSFRRAVGHHQWGVGWGHPSTPFHFWDGEVAHGNPGLLLDETRVCDGAYLHRHVVVLVPKCGVPSLISNQSPRA